MAFLLVLLGQGPDSYIPILENLDSNFVWYSLLSQEGKVFSFDNGEMMDLALGGNLPRNTLPSAFHFSTLLFHFFEPWNAYAINTILVHFTAFSGMVFLLQALNTVKGAIVQVPVAIAFASLPFFGLHGGIAIAGIPLFLYAILTIERKGLSVWPLLIMIYTGFFGSVVLSGAFILLLGILALIIAPFRRKKSLLLGFCVYGFCLILSEINLIIGLLDVDYVSHRTAFQHLSEQLTFKEALKLSSDFFLNGHYHSPSLHSPIILIVLLGTPFWLRSKRHRTFVLFSVGFLALSSVIYGLLHWEASMILKEGFLGRSFHFMRIAFLNSPLWYILLALALSAMAGKFKYSGLLLALLGLTAMIHVWRYNPVLRNNISLWTQQENEIHSYNDLISRDAFLEAKNIIEKDPGNCLSIGSLPAMAMMNDIASLDGYFVNYPLSYKSDFQYIISPELKQSLGFSKSFIGWGNRCYAYVSDMEPCYPEIWECEGEIKDLQTQLDWEKAKKLQAGYVLSTINLLDKELEPKGSWNYLNGKLNLYKIR